MGEAYLIHDVELTEPLPQIHVPSDNSGVALVLRRQGMPVGFLMTAAAPGAVLTGRDVERFIRQHAPDAERGSRRYGEDTPVEAGSLPALTIAICTRNRSAVLERCLQSLLPLKDGPDAPPQQIIVVDNAPSDDQTSKAVARYPGITYVCEPRPGLDFARNRALAEAQGELLAFIDDDVVVDRLWLAGLRQAWAANPDASGYSGPLLPYELETKAQVLFERSGGMGRYFEPRKLTRQLLARSLDHVVEFGAGANMIFRRQVLDRIEGFDVALDTGPPLAGGGDIDAFYRVLRTGGYWIHDPHIVAHHQHRREYSKLRRQMWTWGLGYMAVAVKCFRTDPEFRPLWMKAILLYFIRRGRRIVLSALGLRRFPWPLELAVAEFFGAVVGLMGEYGRSRRRVEAISRQFASRTAQRSLPAGLGAEEVP